MYVVYTHIRLDNNKPFYVGMGLKSRALNFSRRNRYWKNVYLKCNKQIKVIFNYENLTEEEALLKEIDLDLRLYPQ